MGRLSEVILYYLEEVSHNAVWRIGSVHEEKIIVGDSSVFKVGFVVFFFVQSNYSADTNILEDFYVFIRVMPVPVVLVSVLNGAHEGNKLLWDDPVEVSVFNSLIVLILLDVESFEIIPPKLYSKFESLQDVQESAVVEAVSLRGVSVGDKQGMVGLELFESLLSGHLQDHDHKGPHEEGPVHHLVTWVL
jgi:hypothetical protein